jgi:hypothetical protein
MTEHRGYGRVYLGPASDSGPHDGIRGHIVCDALGVHVGCYCEWLIEDASHPSGVEWEVLGEVNQIRNEHALEPLERLDEVNDPRPYRARGRAALAAALGEKPA